MSDTDTVEHQDKGDRGNSEGHRRDDEHRPDPPPGKVIKPHPVHGGDIAPRPPQGGGPRLAASVAAMREQWPEFRYDQREGHGEWSGFLQPIRSRELLALILDDLAHDRDVYVADGGEILHYEKCGATHCTHDWLARIHDPLVQFAVRVRYRGGSALPRASVDAPAVDPSITPHTWSDGAACPFNAADNVWTWTRDTVADFMPHFAIWLVKLLVFQQSGAWIGAQHLATPRPAPC